jgi:hypothetical protein
MSWIAVGDWAERMSAKMEQQRRERLKVAARHFGLDVLDVLGDKELEQRLMARYEATGLPWPTLEEEEDE